MNIIQKGLTIAVITLFIGVAVAPSISANVSKEALVEFTTEVCGLNGWKQIVKLTQEEAEEVEELIDSIRERLNATDTREEAEKVFKEVVVELDEYGLLGGLSVKQAQRLMTGGFQNSQVMKVLEKFYRENQVFYDENFLCLIVGQTDDTYFEGIATRFLVRSARLLENLWNFAEEYEYWFLSTLLFPLLGCSFILTFLAQLTLIMSDINPLSIWQVINFGIEKYDIYYNHWYDDPADGWVTAVGINGFTTWNGWFFGNLDIPKFTHVLGGVAFPGVIGFNGIKITNNNKDSFIGFAVAVSIKE
jgi:hypothetical protein